MTREPLVLIPPMLCDARVFAPQINALSVHHAITFAPTTCGERIEEIASQILEWSPAKFALLGMSMGGAVALEVLRRAPNRVLRIALVSCTAQSETPEAAAAREPLIVAARAGRFQDVVAQEMKPEYLAAGPARKTVMAELAVMARALGPQAYVHQARAMQRRRDQTATLRQIKQPALVLCGAHDPVVPVRRHEFMAEMIPNARLAVIPDAGHFPTLEQPDAVQEVIDRWMQQPLILR